MRAILTPMSANLMMVAIPLGMMMIGVALGAGLAWVVLRNRDHTSGQMLLAVVASAAGGAALFHFIATPSVTDAWTTRQARAELLALPVYRVIARHEPVAYERLLSEYRQVVRDRSHMEVFTEVANAEIANLATTRIAHASDAALLALMQDMLDKLQLLRARSPEDCYRYLFPRVAGPPATARWFDREAQARTLDRMADVIRTASEHPVAVPPRERVEGLLGPVINDIYAQFGENTSLLSRAEEPGVNRQTVCAIATTLYEKVMRLPPADAAAVIRSMTQM
jgi:hypothetical protein